MKLHAVINEVQPEFLPIDFEGVHMIIDGTLAGFYRLHRFNKTEAEVQDLLRPWLIAAKAAWIKRNKNGDHSPVIAVEPARA